MAAPYEIRASEIFKSFAENHVLSGVDLDVHRGEMLAIVGGSGCGKTVLLQILLGQLSPDRGTVQVADHEIEGAPLRELGSLDEEGFAHVRLHSAVVFQKNALFSGTVEENMSLWLREVKRLPEDEIAARVSEALQSVGFDVNASLLSRHREALSGGMAKRVAVARALAMRPIVLYYDEPTTGLDPSNAFGIHDLIMKTHESPGAGGVQRTSIIVTHDKDLLRRLEPRVVMLDEGKVHFDGTYGSFQASKSPVVRPYFEAMPVLHRGHSDNPNNP